MTDKQQRFVQEYCVDMNAAAAARRAGYAPKNAARSGSRLLGRKEVRRAVDEQLRIQAEKAQLSARQVLRELAAIAFGAASDESGAYLKFASKLRALELLGKYTGAFEAARETPGNVCIVDDVR